MSATLYGVIVAPVLGKDGFYRAACFSFASYVEGVSIKGTTLTIGQHVAIVQSGSWTDQRRCFAFASIGDGIYSHVELSDTKNFVIDTNPVGAALAYLLHKAGKAIELYHPARVTAVGAASLTVSDWYSGEALGVWPLANDLDISDFTVGDGVLLRLIPDAIRRVEGWWETVPVPTGYVGFWVKAAGGGTMDAGKAYIDSLGNLDVSTPLDGGLASPNIDPSWPDSTPWARASITNAVEFMVDTGIKSNASMTFYVYVASEGRTVVSHKGGLPEGQDPDYFQPSREVTAGTYSETLGSWNVVLFSGKQTEKINAYAYRGGSGDAIFVAKA
jgi:hypothetical protein